MILHTLDCSLLLGLKQFLLFIKMLRREIFINLALRGIQNNNPTQAGYDMTALQTGYQQPAAHQLDNQFAKK